MKISLCCVAPSVSVLDEEASPQDEVVTRPHRDIRRVRPSAVSLPLGCGAVAACAASTL